MLIFYIVGEQQLFLNSFLPEGQMDRERFVCLHSDWLLPDKPFSQTSRRLGGVKTSNWDSPGRVCWFRLPISYADWWHLKSLTKKGGQRTPPWNANQGAKKDFKESLWRLSTLRPELSFYVLNNLKSFLAGKIFIWSKFKYHELLYDSFVNNLMWVPLSQPLRKAIYKF